MATSSYSGRRPPHEVQRRGELGAAVETAAGEAAFVAPSLSTAAAVEASAADAADEIAAAAACWPALLLVEALRRGVFRCAMRPLVDGGTCGGKEEEDVAAVEFAEPAKLNRVAGGGNCASEPNTGSTTGASTLLWGEAEMLRSGCEGV
jgi:hypothetical protein